MKPLVGIVAVGFAIGALALGCADSWPGRSVTSSTLAGTATATASADTATVYRASVKGKFAYESFQDPLTYFQLYAVDQGGGTSSDPGNVPLDLASVYLSHCTSDFHCSEAYGSTNLNPGAFTIQRISGSSESNDATAHLQTSITLDQGSGSLVGKTLAIDLDWLSSGAVTAYHVLQESRVSGQFAAHLNFLGATSLASASGSVSDGTTDYAALPGSSGFMGDSQQSDLTITR